MAQMNFSWPVRVYYEDTDMGGVVFYANYLKYMERARTEYLRYLGIEQDQLIEEQNIIFAVRSVQLEYNSPARFNDQLTVTVKPVKLKRASMLFEQTVFRTDQQEQVFCQGQILVVSLHADIFKPAALPVSIAELVSTSLMEIDRVD